MPLVTRGVQTFLERGPRRFLFPPEALGLLLAEEEFSMGGVPPSDGLCKSGVNTSETARHIEEARQEAEDALRAAEAARRAAGAARRISLVAWRAAAAARQQQVAEERTAADAREAARQPGQTPAAAKKSLAAALAADKKRQQATEKAATEERKLRAAEERVALTAKRAEDAMREANTLATQEKVRPPFTQKDIDRLKPKRRELASAHEETGREAELE
ncbi:hypothetical protein HPC49_08680 [Pyxidicoccus fallax]|uniref:hypothetical protein n=1 Tax=Pyxidicoccus fallax TaxID=394095 RepID=UPI00149441FA|nr:hypothetical protein [Pyxidicoccus fallax]NPC78321.1 hypothetical protein [Pyxidicoccus fallax]